MNCASCSHEESSHRSFLGDARGCNYITGTTYDGYRTDYDTCTCPRFFVGYLHPSNSFIKFPHDDNMILHAPGECIHCDLWPVWQELRMAWKIPFTDHTMEVSDRRSEDRDVPRTLESDLR